MPKPRLPRDPDDLAHALIRASQSILAEPNWPPTAPNAGQVGPAGGTIIARQQDVIAATAALATARRNLREAVSAGSALLVQVDQATDVLFGAGDARKEAYGVSPKKITKTRRPAPDRVLIRTLADGPLPGSIAAKWEPQPACAYEIQWSTDPNFATISGSTTMTRSKFVVSGLIRGTQYWIRIRAVRASTPGPWSDVATRTAGV